MRDATPEKTGGLIITFQNREGKQFPQKYGKVAGLALVSALSKMGYETTDPLAKSWHHYIMTTFRTGYQRYIPTKKAK